MPKLANWVKESVTGTPGTGTISLSGTAVSGYIRFQDSALLATGNKVNYLVEDGADRELGVGTITTGTPWTLSRDVILATLDSGVFDDTSPTAISLTSSAVVSIVSPAESYGIVVGAAYASTGALVSITTVTANDNTQPTPSTMSDVITVSYTPKFADSTIYIEGLVSGSMSGSGVSAAAGLFKDSGNALAVTNSAPGPSSPYANQLMVCLRESAGTTAARTYKLKTGVLSAGTFYVNGTQAAGQKFGGYSNSYIRVTEFRA